MIGRYGICVGERCLRVMCVCERESDVCGRDCGRLGMMRRLLWIVFWIGYFMLATIMLIIKVENVSWRGVYVCVCAFYGEIVH